MNDAGQRLRRILEDPDAFGTTLLTLVFDRYGPEALSWTPATIRMELREDFGAEIPPWNLDRLMVAANIATGNDFFRRVTRFIPFCNVLSGSPLIPGVFDPADASECAWGITEAMLIHPPEEEEPFSEEIRAYIGKVLDEEGIYTPPDVLKIAIRDTPSGLPDFSALGNDATLFGAAFTIQEAKTKAIEEMLRRNLSELLGQISSLPLLRGRTERLALTLSEGLE